MNRWIMSAALVVVGCGGDTSAKTTATGTGTTDAGKNASPEIAKSPTAPAKGTEVAKTDHDDHSGWWCTEHGIPEEECSMCSDKVAKDAKAKGDWCEKHERAMSQCFYCKPDRREYYAAKYRAKNGKAPPPIDVDEEKKDTKG